MSLLVIGSSMIVGNILEVINLGEDIEFVGRLENVRTSTEIERSLVLKR